MPRAAEEGVASAPVESGPAPHPRGPQGVAAGQIRAILAAGIRAPTAHNAQPWRFRVGPDGVECWRVDERCFTHLDFENGATHVGFGAAIENMALCAAEMGIAVEADLFPAPDRPRLVARIRLSADPHVTPEPELSSHIERRATNRHVGERAPLSEAERAALHGALAGGPARLLLVTEPEALDRLGALVGRSDRIAFSHRAVHHEIFHGFRWSPSEVRANPYGLDVATLEAGRADRFMLRLLSKWPALRAMQLLGGGGGLEAMGRKMIGGASAVGLVVHPGCGPDSYVRGGRAMQRVWLAATRVGLGVQPLANLPYMFARVERGGGAGLDAKQIAAIQALRPDYREIFAPPADHAEILVFRFLRAQPPSTASVRAPYADLVEEQSQS